MEQLFPSFKQLPEGTRNGRVRSPVRGVSPRRPSRPTTSGGSTVSLSGGLGVSGSEVVLEEVSTVQRRL